MRVGVVGPVYPDSFAENIAAGLRAIGAAAHLLGSALPRPRNPPLARGVAAVYRASPALSRQAQRRIVERARDLELNLVITVQPVLHPAVVTALRAAGVKTCLWFPDSLANLDRHWVALTPFDAMFFKEPLLVRRMSDVLQLPVQLLPQACNPEWHRIPAGPAEAESTSEEHGDGPGHVVVAGNLYGTRVRLLSMLLDEGIPLRIYGGKPAPQITDPRIRRAHTGIYVTRSDKARVFRAAVAVLNSMHPTEVEGVNSRLFEAAGCGAAVVTEHRAQVPELFTPESEVRCFRTFDELVGQLKRLLAEPGTGRALGDAAAERAHAEHTYPHRLTRLLEVVS